MEEDFSNAPVGSRWLVNYNWYTGIEVEVISRTKELIAWQRINECKTRAIDPIETFFGPLRRAIPFAPKPKKSWWSYFFG